MQPSDIGEGAIGVINVWGEFSYVSVERKAESGKFRFFWVILGEAVPISVELGIVCISFFGKAPHSRGHDNTKLFENATDPIGVEDWNCYQTSYSMCFKCFK